LRLLATLRQNLALTSHFFKRN